jgi:hypothetical protein
METLKAKQTYNFYPSVIGAKGFHYPDWDNASQINFEVDTTLKFLPFVCLQNRELNAFQIPPDLQAFLKLETPVIWICK